jgi:phage terminase small subunit
VPELKNKKRESFCQFMATTNKQSLSAKKAGYSEKNAHIIGYQLMQIPEVIDRVNEIKDNKKEEINFNVDVVEELEKQYDSAQKKHNIPGALKALELIQKVRGNKSSNEIEISVESLEENIINCLNRISTEKVKELLLKSNHSKIILQLESNIEQLQQHQEKISQESQE